MSLLNEWLDLHGETPMTRAEIDAELAKGRRNARLREQGLPLDDEIEHFDDCESWYGQDCDCSVRWIGMEEDD